VDKVARFPAEDRAALFSETGAALGVANGIVEKDFWVCWTLKRLFSLPKNDAPALVFKGGTSLSKAYDAIRRGHAAFKRFDHCDSFTGNTRWYDSGPWDGVVEIAPRMIWIKRSASRRGPARHRLTN
jgi:hypothetical protein